MEILRKIKERVAMDMVTVMQNLNIKKKKVNTDMAMEIPKNKKKRLATVTDMVIENLKIKKKRVNKVTAKVMLKIKKKRVNMDTAMAMVILKTRKKSQATDMETLKKSKRRANMGMAMEIQRTRNNRLATVTGTGFMPPWLPDPVDEGFSGERGLTPRQIDTIRRWVRAGAIEGAPADLPPPPRFAAGGESTFASEEPFTVHEHHLKVVGRTYEPLEGEPVHLYEYTFNSNRFRLAPSEPEDEMDRHIDGAAVKFSYDLSPMRVVSRETKRPMTEWLLGLCAWVGGVYTVSGLLSALVENSFRAVKRRVGKLA